MKKKSETLAEFYRSQVAAFLGTATDYLAVIGLTELLGLWYVWSNMLGNLSGALCNFTLGRNWTFKSQEGNIYHQAFRYGLVSTSSMALNTSGLYLLTECTSLHYIFSKILVGILIAVSFNYFLQKHFVFRKGLPKQSD